MEVEVELKSLVSHLSELLSNASLLSDVLSPLHSLSSLLFPSTPANTCSAQLDQLVANCRRSALEAYPEKDVLQVLRFHFYSGASFTAIASILLYRVSFDWLSCFSLSQQKYLFDQFFIKGLPTKVLLVLVPALRPKLPNSEEESLMNSNSVCATAERLLVTCLREEHFLRKIALSYVDLIKEEGFGDEESMLQQEVSILKASQVISSIPDKARHQAPELLHSPLFYQFTVSELLSAAKEEHQRLSLKTKGATKNKYKAALFIADFFTRICRRGHADILASEMVTCLLQDIREVTLPGDNGESCINFKSVKEDLGLSIWPELIECMKDSHAVERLAEAILWDMARKDVLDWDAFCVVWTLFATLAGCEATIRTIFTERFLLWKVFPIRCLRWILHMAVFRYPPGGNGLSLKGNEFQGDVVQRLFEVWGENKFIQSAPMEQQAYLTAAVGLSLEALNKEALEGPGNLLRSLLQGVTKRLDSPIPFVRNSAKRVALAFSLVVNPQQPLLLDDEDEIEDLSNWDDLNKHAKAKESRKLQLEHKDGPSLSRDQGGLANCYKVQSDVVKTGETKKERKLKSLNEPYDPDEVIDLATYVPDPSSEDTETDNESESSLQPYDLSDDESDLARGKFPMQLSDCIANLRKGDEPNIVVQALDVIEKLVRAKPDELDVAAPELAHALIHVRCSTVAVEGEEASEEEKRYNGLVALLACAPNAVVRVSTTELYSPQVDVSQRILILEAMSDAARELAGGSIQEGPLHNSKKGLIEQVSGRKWYEPGEDPRPLGSGPWKKVDSPSLLEGWSFKYERDLPLKQGQKVLGKSRRWGQRSMELRHNHQRTFSHKRNQFAPLAALFMIPVMAGYDKIGHGVDFVGRDFIVLGRLLYMLGVCMECLSLQPEASVLAVAVLDLLQSRRVSSHEEPYVRRSALYLASQIMLALHPSHVVTAVNGGDEAIAKGLDWIREWALRVADEDTDSECSMMAMSCVQLHSELAMQAMRVMDSPSLPTSNIKKLEYKVARGSIILP